MLFSRGEKINKSIYYDIYIDINIYINHTNKKTNKKNTITQKHNFMIINTKTNHHHQMKDLYQDH